MIYISGFTSCVGEKKEIAELRSNDTYENSLIDDLINSGGLSSYRVSRETPYKMAASCIRKFIDKYDVKAEDVDYVVYATSTLWNPEFTSRGHISNLLIDSGLVGSIPLAVFGHGCANFHAAILLAKSICTSEDSNVLVVTVDKAGSQPTRIISPGVSIASDGAACALVSGSLKLDKAYSIDSVNIQYGPELADMDVNASRSEYFDRVAKGVRTSVRDSLEQSRCKPRDVVRVFTNNYRKPTIEMFTSLCGFNEKQLYLDTLAEYGHCFAADPFIMLEASTPIVGTSLVLGTGTQTWAAATLTFNE